jgi:hypothetical protein
MAHIRFDITGPVAATVPVSVPVSGVRVGSSFRCQQNPPRCRRRCSWLMARVLSAMAPTFLAAVEVVAAIIAALSRQKEASTDAGLHLYL